VPLRRRVVLLLAGAFWPSWPSWPALARGAPADGGLPRVLILGDAVSTQAAADVAKLLRERAEVVAVPIAPGEVRDSGTVLAELDRLLGTGRWDVIHFNVGLGDLVHRAPGREDYRAMARAAGGVRVTPPDRYAENLAALVGRLEATGAALVWSSTTPIQADLGGIFVAGSEVEYNSLAAGIMAARGVPINDLHALALAALAEHAAESKRPVNLGNPFELRVGKEPVPLAAAIAAAIEAALARRAGLTTQPAAK